MTLMMVGEMLELDSDFVSILLMVHTKTYRLRRSGFKKTVMTHPEVSSWPVRKGLLIHFDPFFVNTLQMLHGNGKYLPTLG